MNIINPDQNPNSIEASIRRVQEHIDTGLSLLNGVVNCFNYGYNEFWKGTDEEVENKANFMGPLKVQLMFERNTALATVLNTAIDERNEALVAAGYAPLNVAKINAVAARDLQWNGTQFEIIPPPIEETPEEPESPPVIPTP